LPLRLPRTVYVCRMNDARRRQLLAIATVFPFIGEVISPAISTEWREEGRETPWGGGRSYLRVSFCCTFGVADPIGALGERRRSLPSEAADDSRYRCWSIRWSKSSMAPHVQSEVSCSPVTTALYNDSIEIMNILLAQ